MNANKSPIYLRISIVITLTLISLTVPVRLPDARQVRLAQAEGLCTAPFISVSLPLTDLGQGEYVRFSGGPESGPTGYTGGLYPGGINVRPPAHESAGLAMVDQIKPLNSSGNYDPANGKIAFISVGMSNTNLEFKEFLEQAEASPYLNPYLVLINGAQGSMVSNDWADPNGDPWGKLFDILGMEGVSKDQVQVAWVKLTQFGMGDFNFPEKAQSLQSDLEEVVRNLTTYFPNIKMAFFSSRTRSFQYWGETISPEPTAFETGLAVKWMIEKQINGDPDLNFNPGAGPVVAPYLSWGPYLWIDGLNQRSDGLTWTQFDVGEDCTHPSALGIQKVVLQLFNFFNYDSLTKAWFLADPGNPIPPAPPPGNFTEFFFLPVVVNNLTAQSHP